MLGYVNTKLEENPSFNIVHDSTSVDGWDMLEEPHIVEGETLMHGNVEHQILYVRWAFQHPSNGQIEERSHPMTKISCD